MIFPLSTYPLDVINDYPFNYDDNHQYAEEVIFAAQLICDEEPFPNLVCTVVQPQGFIPHSACPIQNQRSGYDDRLVSPALWESPEQHPSGLRVDTCKRHTQGVLNGT
jgi:hypothetical protein